MHCINFRCLFHLRWVQVAIVLILAVGSLSAQKYRGNPNFLDFNQKPYYFGITLGINSSNFKPYRSKQFLMSDSIQTVESVTGPGFNLGIVTNLKMGDYFDWAADLYQLPRPPRVARSSAKEQLPLMLLSFMSESRRLDNQRMKKELRLHLRYPTVAQGLAPVCATV